MKYEEKPLLHVHKENNHYVCYSVGFMAIGTFVIKNRPLKTFKCFRSSSCLVGTKTSMADRQQHEDYKHKFEIFLFDYLVEKH